MAARRSSTDVALEAAYRRIPDVECRGLCQASCTGPIPASRREHQRVRAVGRPLPLTVEPCRNLTALGQCGVYEVRPAICRLWAAVENMPCPHGCEPAGGRLSRAEGGTIVQQIVDAAGEAGT